MAAAAAARLMMSEREMYTVRLERRQFFVKSRQKIPMKKKKNKTKEKEKKKEKQRLLFYTCINSPLSGR